MNVLRSTATTIMALALFTSACAGTGPLRTGSASRPASGASGYVTILLANNSYSPMKVYAVVNDVPIRLGTATGNAITRFTAHPALFPAGWLRVVASQFGGNDVADSGPVAVYAGQSLTFTIEPTTAASFALVR
jgi:hypothetical protein